MTGPPYDRRHPYPALVKRSLEATQFTNTLEECVIDFQIEVRGTVVTCEHHQRVVA